MASVGFAPAISLVSIIDFICCLLPIALNANPLIAPLATVPIGGLISSTVLSRIVTLAMYN